MNKYNILLAAIFILTSHTCIFCQMTSDKLVNANGDLIENASISIKNEVDNEQGIVKKTYYDNDGRLVFQRNYSFEGSLMYDENGIAVYEYQYDENGNISEERYFDEKKVAFRRENVGAAIIKRKFNAAGKVTKIAYFSAKDKPLENGVAAITFEYSADGMTGLEKHFNSAGLLVDFCAPIISLEFNSEGQIVRKIYMNNHEQICGRFMDEDENEVAMIEYNYDNLGDVVTQKAFTKDGKLLGVLHS